MDHACTALIDVRLQGVAGCVAIEPRLISPVGGRVVEAGVGKTEDGLDGARRGAKLREEGESEECHRVAGADQA